jgi:alkanesulfonate monooxygenase SsuD/methylene tetrahydromethanopterin reductase-like flavin-dependent oxidoreductase (luciferase family)
MLGRFAGAPARFVWCTLPLGPAILPAVPQYAIGLPTVGEFGDVNALCDLAVRAEQHGWDGVHLWDHLLYHDPPGR